MSLKMMSEKWQPFCLNLNLLSSRQKYEHIVLLHGNNSIVVHLIKVDGKTYQFQSVDISAL